MENPLKKVELPKQIVKLKSTFTMTLNIEPGSMEWAKDMESAVVFLSGICQPLWASALEDLSWEKKCIVREFNEAGVTAATVIELKRIDMDNIKTKTPE